MDGWMRCGAAVAIGGIYRQMIENYIGEPLVERAGGHHGDERGVGRAGLAGGAHHLHSFFGGEERVGVVVDQCVDRSIVDEKQGHCPHPYP